MEAAGVEVPAPPIAEAYVARVDASVASEVFSVASALRDGGVAAEMDHQGRSLKAQFKQADRLGARAVVVVGPDEVAAGEVTVRHMGTREENRVAIADVVGAVRDLIG